MPGILSWGKKRGVLAIPICCEWILLTIEGKVSPKFVKESFKIEGPETLFQNIEKKKNIPPHFETFLLNSF